MKKLYFPINQKIEYPQLRVVDKEGKSIGILGKDEALKKAQEEGLDLVLINGDAAPPVAKIVELGKFLYDQKQKLKKVSKPGKTSGQKELRLTPNIGRGDLDNRINRTREFLSNRDKVKFVVEFRGREMAHPEVGRDKLNIIFESLRDISEIEKEPYWEGRRLMASIKPK